MLQTAATFLSLQHLSIFWQRRKEEEKKGEKRTIYTQLSQWDEQTFVWMTISAEGGGLHDTEDNS